MKADVEPKAAAGGESAAAGDVLLSVENVSLSFGGVKALRDVSFDIRKGEIRAIGDVLADQLFFMIRVGIDCLALHPSVQEETARRALDRFAFVYQQSSDDRRPVWTLRNG